MSLIRFPPMFDPFQDMEDMMKRFPSYAGGALANQKAFVPAMDVYETKDSVVIETPLAGVDPKDVNVSVEKGVLTIEGSTKKEHEAEEKNYYWKETRSGSFFRQLALPTAVREDEVVAVFEDGILKINCPKREGGETKKIDIQIGKK